MQIKFPSIILTILLGYSTAAWTAVTEKNALYQHHSPYLAMHGEDPIQWQEWNAATVAKARKQNKLLFVSIGYFSCHWCHVMQRESFQDMKIAAVLNQNFISVKVDREIDSALDTKLIDFVERTHGIAGWPLNVFITPEGYPLVGMVYVPADDFLKIVQKLDHEWRRDAAGLKKLARDTAAELDTARLPKPQTEAEINPALAPAFVNAFVQQSFRLADEMQGGFGEENKFPSVPQLATLLAIYADRPEPRLKNFLQLTLVQMAALGLRDQLDGGFYRYVVDPAWHIPHFEKMLYDNALLAKLYIDASVILQEPGFAAVGRDTLDFMFKQLRGDNGVFLSSLSAIDTDGVEGGTYLWQLDELSKLLSAEEVAAVRAFWNVQGAPELDAGYHLIQTRSVSDVAKDLQLSESELRERIERARAKLLASRSQRGLPVDHKQLAAWNGLALSAFTAGAKHFGKPEYRQAAQAIVNQVRRHWWDNKQGTLSRLVTGKKTISRGVLEDYAYVAQGLFDWWQFTDQKADRILLEKMLSQAWRRFYGADGWLLAEDPLLKYKRGETVVKDGAMPSPAGILIHTTLRYGKSDFVESARRAMLVGHDQTENEAFWYATLIQNFLLYSRLHGS